MLSDPPESNTPSPLLDVRDLKVHFGTGPGAVRAVDGISFDILPGETVALVGESGCGKSVTAQALARLVPEPPGIYAGGEIRFAGRSVLDMDERELRKLRGNEIAYIFQEPWACLNPVFRIGGQIAEAIRLHRPGVNPRDEVPELLKLVGFPNPNRGARAYPHQLSGGMQQRAMIAMALACRPRLLVADEPTTALDVTIQAQIMDLLARLQAERGMAVLLINHNLALVAGTARRISVMHFGKIVEQGLTRDVLRHPRHAYTRTLLDAVPRLHGPVRAGPMAQPAPLIEVEDLRVTYGKGRNQVEAVRGVSFVIQPGQSVGLVGESGCGKSTVGRALLRLEPAAGGAIRFRGRDIAAWRGRALRRYREEVQMVFQDPYGSLNPRLTVGAALREVLKVHGVARRAERDRRAAELMASVGLGPEMLDRYPHEFSGGQRQRVGIARALAVDPKLLVADEPVSALDVRVQAQVLKLMKELLEGRDLAYLFISHDLAVVRSLCDWVLVMHAGRIVEAGPPDRLFVAPEHPYTRTLLDAVPDLDARLAS